MPPRERRVHSRGGSRCSAGSGPGGFLTDPISGGFFGQLAETTTASNGAPVWFDLGVPFLPGGVKAIGLAQYQGPFVADGNFPDVKDQEPNTYDTDTIYVTNGSTVLVTKDQNDKASNHELAYKLEIYFNTRGAPAVAINEDLRGRTEWKAPDIRAREAELFQLIEEVWQFGMMPPRAQAAE